MESSLLAFRLESASVVLPEPYKARYTVLPTSSSREHPTFRLQVSQDHKSSASLPDGLSCDGFSFSQYSGLTRSTPAKSNNSAWARARRCPLVLIFWDKAVNPVTNLWILAYTIFTCRSEVEAVRLAFSSAREDQSKLISELLETGLAILHPTPSAPPGQPTPTSEDHVGQFLIYRSSFWQGAGSPFGPRAVWLFDKKATSPQLRQSLCTPLRPLEYTVTTGFPGTRVYARHPIRQPKPDPGSMIYSRYIPHLDETFSMIALDWANEEHVNYFHTWQNEPRVAEAWNETGTLEEHREYLRKVHEDPHQFTVLGQFDGVPFAYFEIYWAKEDHMGAFYNAQDYDRGRHLLVGDARFRGPHRVNAWHTGLTHYMFLDDPRTDCVVAEPRATNAKMLSYDRDYGYNVEKIIDLPHKRAALIKCNREKFFQSFPFMSDSTTDAPERFSPGIRKSVL